MEFVIVSNQMLAQVHTPVVNRGVPVGGGGLDPVYFLLLFLFYFLFFLIIVLNILFFRTLGVHDKMYGLLSQR